MDRIKFLTQDVRNAYDLRSRDSLEWALERIIEDYIKLLGTQMEAYGTQEPQHPISELLTYAGNPTSYRFILYHPQIPLGSKQCQWPGSWKVQLVLNDGRALTAIRLADNTVQFKGL